MQRKAPEHFAWRFTLMEKEDHGSIPHRSTYDGLEALFEDWRLPAEVAQTGTLEALDSHYAGLSEKYGYRIITPEAQVNLLGYRLLGQGKNDEAISVFKRNVQVYPESANVYDSLGDAYDAAGQLEQAKEHYEIGCRKGKAAAHPSTQVYCGNLERIEKKLDGM